ncbi:MAG: RluA family pseudouridine synthase [Bacteroidia bacterium]|nr:RluA family pseudouridine synthase [Bacteroidia bacterium]
MSLQVLFEDNHLIAVAKKSGQTVQPEPNKPISLEEDVKAYIKHKYNKPGDVFLGVIHRLDMPVTGIVLFAKTSKALVRMNDLFKNRKVEKYYEAKVEGKPLYETDTLIHFLVRNENKNITQAHLRPVPNAEKATLSFEIKYVNNNNCILRIKLLTGRKHQIRAQLGAINCPIVGDVKYGASKPNPDGSISLAAVELAFEHPVTKAPVKILYQPNN